MADCGTVAGAVVVPTVVVINATVIITVLAISPIFGLCLLSD